MQTHIFCDSQGRLSHYRAPDPVILTSGIDDVRPCEDDPATPLIRTGNGDFTQDFTPEINSQSADVRRTVGGMVWLALGVAVAAGVMLLAFLIGRWIG